MTDVDRVWREKGCHACGDAHIVSAFRDPDTGWETRLCRTCLLTRLDPIPEENR